MVLIALGLQQKVVVDFLEGGVAGGVIFAGDTVVIFLSAPQTTGNQ